MQGRPPSFLSALSRSKAARGVRGSASKRFRAPSFREGSRSLGWDCALVVGCERGAQARRGVFGVRLALHRLHHLAHKEAKELLLATSVGG